MGIDMVIMRLYLGVQAEVENMVSLWDSNPHKLGF
jgi:hypothetical protein